MASAVSTNVRGFEPARERCHSRPNEGDRRAQRLLDTALGGWCQTPEMGVLRSQNPRSATCKLWQIAI